MIDNTKEIENCLLALMLWAGVPPKRVNLQTWRCCTQACFGGHLATWAEFQSKEVKADWTGAPVFLDYSFENTAGPDEVAHQLFGRFDMFDRRDKNELGTDHQVIVDRLEKQIERLTTEEQA